DSGTVSRDDAGPGGSLRADPFAIAAPPITNDNATNPRSPTTLGTLRPPARGELGEKRRCASGNRTLTSHLDLRRWRMPVCVRLGSTDGYRCRRSSPIAVDPGGPAKYREPTVPLCAWEAGRALCHSVRAFCA